MSMSVKRRFAPSSQQNESRLNKKICLKNVKFDNNNNNNNSSIVKKVCSYKSSGQKLNNYCESSSSSEDDEDEDDYHNNSDINDFDRSNELKVKSLRFANSIDSKLSKAVSQYSDDEENGYEDENDIIDSNRKYNDDENDDNDNNSSSSSSNNTLVDQFSNKKRCSSTNDILKVNYVSGHGLLNNKRYSVNISDVVKSIPLNSNNPTVGDNFHSFNITNKSLKHTGNIPRSDFIARSRCFEYLVGAIDEAWARYCDSTSYDEDLAYGYEDCSPKDETQQNVAATPNSNTYTSEDDEGYKTEFSATTTVTEYESDFHPNNKMRSFSMIGNNNNNNNNNNMNFVHGNSNVTRRVSEVPENLRLQGLKDRFTKAKYYLEDLVDSDLYNDCLSFWNKWDLIKYSIVDFVEEDEEDDDVERKVDELELGRFAGSYVN